MTPPQTTRGEGPIERVAAAMYPDLGWDRSDQQWMSVARADAMDRARAAIFALREPDAAMLRAGRSIKHEYSDPLLNGLNAGAVFKAMIDAALSTSTPDAKERE